MSFDDDMAGIDSATAIASHVMKYSETCLHMEESRLGSLESMAANLLMAASIVSVTFVGILQLLNESGLLIHSGCQVCIVLAGASLLISLIVLFLSNWRRKYEIPSAQNEKVVELFREKGVEKTGLESIWRVTELTSETYCRCANSLTKKNDAIRGWLHFSLAMLLVTVILIALLLIQVLIIIHFS